MESKIDQNDSRKLTGCTEISDHKFNISGVDWTLILQNEPIVEIRCWRTVFNLSLYFGKMSSSVHVSSSKYCMIMCLSCLNEDFFIWISSSKLIFRIWKLKLWLIIGFFGKLDEVAFWKI
jgi:hypothetical protein